MENLQINLKSVNPGAIKVCHVLQQAGYQAFIVGGCVRDLLLGITPKDWDITTDAKPENVLKLFDKTYPTGLQHGTITVAMGEGVENHFEVTTFRIEGEYKDGRRPEEVFFVNNIEQDLARRDLTINAIAFDPINNKLIDPFGGIDDLSSKIIKAVGDPNARFNEDGLRIMRVARFAARFNYQIEEKTLQGISSNLGTLKKVSKERIKDELCKLLMSSNPLYGLDILINNGVINIISPILSTPVYRHFYQFINQCRGDLETKIALLYANGATTKTQNDLIDLKFSNKEIKRILFLLNSLDHPFYKEANNYPDRNNKRHVNNYKLFIAHFKNESPDPWIHTLNQFIILTEAMGLQTKSTLSSFNDINVIARKEMNISGDDLIAGGIKPGPEIKSILDKCYKEILNYPEHNTKEFLLSIV